MRLVLAHLAEAAHAAHVDPHFLCRRWAGLVAHVVEDAIDEVGLSVAVTPGDVGGMRVTDHPPVDVTSSGARDWKCRHGDPAARHGLAVRRGKSKVGQHDWKVAVARQQTHRAAVIPGDRGETTGDDGDGVAGEDAARGSAGCAG